MSENYREVLGVRIWDPSYQEFTDWFYSQVHEGRGEQLVFANAHTLNLAFVDAGYRDAINGADRVIRDGSGVELAGKILKTRFGCNFCGSDLLPRLFVEAREEIRVFLYGASERSNWLARERIERDYPKISVVGSINGFVAEHVAVAAIRQSMPDLLLVALGQPRQDLFLAKHRSSLGFKLGVGVGALFDVLSDEVRRAPAWIRRAKSEWLYRLIREPRRMFGRYILGNPMFVWRVLRSRRWAEGSRAEPC